MSVRHCLCYCVCVVCALISGSSDEVCLCVRAHIENEARLPNWPESIQSVSQWPKCWQRHTIWSFEATAEKNCSQWAVRLIVIDGIMLMPCSSSSAAVARMIWATLRTNRHHSREQIMKSKRKGDAAERCSANHHLFVWLFVCLKKEKKWMWLPFLFHSVNLFPSFAICCFLLLALVMISIHYLITGLPCCFCAALNLEICYSHCFLLSLSFECPFLSFSSNFCFPNKGD